MTVACDGHTCGVARTGGSIPPTGAISVETNMKKILLILGAALGGALGFIYGQKAGIK